MACYACHIHVCSTLCMNVGTGYGATRIEEWEATSFIHAKKCQERDRDYILSSDIE